MAKRVADRRADPTHRRAGLSQAAPLLAGSCMPVLGSVLITPVLPRLSEHFGGVPGADVLVPLIVALPALMIAVFAPFAGQIVDRLGRRSLLLGAMLVYALAGTAPVWLDSLAAILASRVVVGICEAAIMTACTTLLVDYFPGERRRNRYLGLQTVVTTLAATAFIAIGGALGASGWKTPFWVYSVSIGIAAVMAVLLWEPTDADAGPQAIERTAAGGRFRLRTRIPWERIGGPLWVTVFGGFTFYVLVLEVGYLVVATGVAAENTQVIGWVAAVSSLATALGGLSFSRISRLPRGVVLPAAFLLQSVGMIAIWVVPTGPGLIAGAAITSFGSGVLLPSLITWVVAAAQFTDRGRITGWWTAAFFLGQSLTPVLIAGLTLAAGSLTAAVGLAGIAAAVASAVVGSVLSDRYRRS
ncbi:MFS transporter [Agromyces sp. CFH 90414]|uniref:MFS transporter n=2 Tax=Agromyces agglutinans TaxID=2662258 RepID=A0A6I2F5X3_9MICO|nr:MFS transporter [Agromyces agglutinans]